MANLAFKEVFGGSDDEVRSLEAFFVLNSFGHKLTAPLLSLSLPSQEIESFAGFSLKAVIEEYKKLVLTCRTEGGEERGKDGEIERKVQRPRRSGKAVGGHYLEYLA